MPSMTLYSSTEDMDQTGLLTRLRRRLRMAAKIRPTTPSELEAAHKLGGFSSRYITCRARLRDENASIAHLSVIGVPVTGHPLLIQGEMVGDVSKARFQWFRGVRNRKWRAIPHATTTQYVPRFEDTGCDLRVTCTLPGRRGAYVVGHSAPVGPVRLSEEVRAAVVERMNSRASLFSVMLTSGRKVTLRLSETSVRILVRKETVVRVPLGGESHATVRSCGDARMFEVATDDGRRYALTAASRDERDAIVTLAQLYADEAHVVVERGTA